MKIAIKTKNLSLRIFTIKDITPEYVKALNSKEVVGLTESRYRKWDSRSVRDYVEEKGNKTNCSLILGIFLKGGGKHIGNIRLHSFSAYNKRVEVGFLIWDHNEWGKGYITEALTSLFSYIFNSLNLHKIIIEYYSLNKATEKVTRNLGFRTEAVLKDHFLVDGKYIDAVRVAKINPNH